MIKERCDICGARAPAMFEVTVHGQTSAEPQRLCTTCTIDVKQTGLRLTVRRLTHCRYPDAHAQYLHRTR